MPVADPNFNLTNFHGILTCSPTMLQLFEQIRRAARTPATVLIRGESGTGKELVARALHESSPRSAKPFRAINCATLTPELLASELFGHVRGAFTGAVRDRKGLFALADGGTIFLDEIAELPMELQARLLRVLQERTFIPLGASDPVSVDVRLVSATHKALRAEVEARQFREDLMYRVRVVVLYLPGLRERGDDIEALTWHFIRAFNREGYRHVTHIDDAALEALRTYSWPGNIRELRNNVEAAFAIGVGPVIQLEDLAPELRGIAPVEQHAAMTVQDVERQQILDALREHRGRRNEAAEALGMSRSTLWRKMKQYGLDAR